MSPREADILLYPIHWLHNKPEGVSAGPTFPFGSSPQQGCIGTINPLGACTFNPTPHAKDQQGSPCIPHQCLQTLRRACRTPGAHLCLISGMLMQLAAATAAKGTYRPMMAGKCWGEKQENIM